MHERKTGGAVWVWVVLALFLLAMGYLGWLVERSNQASESLYQIDEPLGGATSAEVILRSGIGELHIGAGETDGPLLSGEVNLIPGEELEISRNEEGGKVQLALAPAGTAARSMTSEQEFWDLTLSPQIPIELRVESGIGKAELDLSGLWLERLTYQGRVGSASITLPSEGSFVGRIESGEGEITLLIPEGVAVQVETERGLGTVEANGLERVGRGTYQTPGFRDGSQVSVASGVGDIHISVLE